MDAVLLGHLDFDLTLYKLSLIRASITFWEREEIKKEIRNYFTNSDGASWSLKTWHQITQKVLELVDSSDALVARVVPEFKDAVLNAGVKIFDWISYILLELCLDISYAEHIYWTPLGFIDEERIFKTFWKNDQSLYKGDIKIFQLACMFTQEEFIRTHKDEILNQWEKLGVIANLENIDDKVYGIISVCLSLYINQTLFKKRNYFYYVFEKLYQLYLEVKQGVVVIQSSDLIKKFDQQNVLRNMLNDSVQKGQVAPHHVMVKLCVFAGLTHGTRYYYKKLDGSQKGHINTWIKSYCREKLHIRNLNHYEAEKLREISVFIDYNDLYSTPSLLLLYLCPLESVIWPNFRMLLNREDCHLDNFFKDFFDVLYNDHDTGLPAKRNLFQKLLTELLIKVSDKKDEETKESFIINIINLSDLTRDFTTLRLFLDIFQVDSVKIQYYLRFVQWRMRSDDWDLEKKFYNEMFKSSEDRIVFFTEQFYKTGLLINSEFETWEKLYLFLNVLDTPLRDSIDPLKCLRFLAERGEIESCDKFIKFWHQSKEDQINLKNNFKESSYLPECFYKLWVGELFPRFAMTSASASTELLNWIFESKKEVVEFKTNRISILGLLDASFHNADQDFLEFIFIYGRENKFYEVIGKFIYFCGITPRTIANVKEELRNKIGEIRSNNSDSRNYETLQFLTDWIEEMEEFD